MHTQEHTQEHTVRQAQQTAAMSFLRKLSLRKKGSSAESDDSDATTKAQEELGQLNVGQPASEEKAKSASGQDASTNGDDEDDDDAAFEEKAVRSRLVCFQRRPFRSALLLSSTAHTVPSVSLFMQQRTKTKKGVFRRAISFRRNTSTTAFQPAESGDEQEVRKQSRKQTQK